MVTVMITIYLFIAATTEDVPGRGSEGLLQQGGVALGVQYRYTKSVILYSTVEQNLLYCTVQLNRICYIVQFRCTEQVILYSTGVQSRSSLTLPH